jgi:hypothetical protein
MEKCIHCHKVRNGPNNWRHFLATYHEVELQHAVCPQCSIPLFPKFYRVQEFSSQGTVNGTLTKNFFDRFSPTAHLKTLSSKIWCL